MIGSRFAGAALTAASLALARTSAAEPGDAPEPPRRPGHVITYTVLSTPIFCGEIGYEQRFHKNMTVAFGALIGRDELSLKGESTGTYDRADLQFVGWRVETFLYPLRQGAPGGPFVSAFFSNVQYSADFEGDPSRRSAGTYDYAGGTLGWSFLLWRLNAKLGVGGGYQWTATSFGERLADLNGPRAAFRLDLGFTF